MTPPHVDADVLRTLHRLHRQLTDLNERLERGPKITRAAKTNVKHCEELLAEVRDELKSLRMAADKKQTQLKGGEGKIEDLKRKLNTASSNREYQVLKDQMAAEQMTNSVLDDEILEAWEKIDQFQEKIGTAESTLAQARQRAEKADREVTEQEPRIRDDLTRLEAELKECEANLPAEIRDLYNRVIRHRGEDALATVENQYCSGCHQQVPLNVCSEIMLGRPMFCKTCGRLLYMPEGLSPDAV